MILGCAVSQPRRHPGAIDFENVSRRMTRPSVSIERYEGTRESRNGKPEDFCDDDAVGTGAGRGRLRADASYGAAVGY